VKYVQQIQQKAYHTGNIRT